MAKLKGRGTGQRVRVLVVENDQERLARLLDRLVVEGIEATGVTTAVEALGMLEHEAADIVVTDVPCSDVDGWTFLQDVRNRCRDCRIIIYTRGGSCETAEKAVNVGAFASVPKTGEIDEEVSDVVRHVHRACEEILSQYAGSLETIVAQRTADLNDQIARLVRLHTLVMTLHATTDRNIVYEATMDAVVTIAGVDRCAILLFDPDGVMRFKAWRGLSPIYRQSVEGHGPWLPHTVDAAPILVSDVSGEPTLSRYRELFQREGIGALAFIPLTAAVEERLLGKLMLYARSPHVWSEADIRLAQLIADHLVSALLRIEAEQTLRQTYKEREQICHDVHDGILQSLYSVGLLLEVAKRELVHEGVGEAVPSVAGSLEKAVSHLNTVIGEIRRFLEHLKNGSVADQRTDVVQALDELLTAVQSVDPIPIERRLMVRRPLLLPADQVAHLRLIVKEALSNSLRHSHAARRWVALQRRRSGVRLEVGDDGIGFDRRLKQRHGDGLSSMASRAELIGGRLTIRTRRGRGTRVMLDLPCAGGAEPLAFHERPVMSATESRAGGIRL